MINVRRVGRYARAHTCARAHADINKSWCQRFVGKLSMAVAKARVSSSQSAVFDPIAQSDHAQALLEQGHLTNALKLYQQILKAYLAQYGLVHPLVADAYNK